MPRASTRSAPVPSRSSSSPVGTLTLTATEMPPSSVLSEVRLAADDDVADAAGVRARVGRAVAEPERVERVDGDGVAVLLRLGGRRRGPQDAREHARVHVQLDEGHDHAEVDAIGEAELEHGGEHVAIDVDADLLLEQIALEVRGQVGELAGVGVRAAAVVVLEDERQVAVLEVDAVDPIVVERLLAEAEREHALAERGGALGERRSRRPGR